MLTNRFIRKICQEKLPQRIKLINEFQELYRKSKTPLQICIRSNCIVTNSTRNYPKNRLFHSSIVTSYLMSPKCFSVTLRRNLFSSPKKEEFFKNQDQVPSDFSLIYKASIDKYLIYGQRIASAGMLALLGLGVRELYYLNVPHIVYSVEHVRSYTEFIMFNIGLACMVIIIQSFITKFPIRMYHNSSDDAYIAIFVNLLGLPSKMKFVKGQVQKLKSSGPLPWKNDRFSIQSKKVILLEQYFRLPADYNALLNIAMDKDS